MSGGEQPTRRNVILAGGALVVATGVGVAALQRGPADEFASLGRGIDDVILNSSRGGDVRWGDLRGAPRALFFGFTHCPVICPVTVYELTAAADRIGAEADNLRVDFVTVDPERDTPELLASYFSGFGPKVTGFTGAADALGRVMRAYEVTATRVDDGSERYSFDHTATAFLIDRRGRVRDVVVYGSEPAIIEARVRDLLRR